MQYILRPYGTADFYNTVYSRAISTNYRRHFKKFNYHMCSVYLHHVSFFFKDSSCKLKICITINFDIQKLANNGGFFNVEPIIIFQVDQLSTLDPLHTQSTMAIP